MGIIGPVVSFKQIFGYRQSGEVLDPSCKAIVRPRRGQTGKSLGALARSVCLLTGMRCKEDFAPNRTYQPMGWAKAMLVWAGDFFALHQASTSSAVCLDRSAGLWWILKTGARDGAARKGQISRLTDVASRGILVCSNTADGNRSKTDALFATHPEDDGLALRSRLDAQSSLAQDRDARPKANQTRSRSTPANNEEGRPSDF
ncbi:hypothetical protein BCR34DRAFT_592633 [Clohesyomyces aquaticus]|uniref:Uncharacterized protein n=1 Tax=Clohesyomyces aquaticus TaxID=1231657 RepID=A0A1Y1YQI6_9PLEO|nr:hypothetical protein BCR34DRAFT_592633 [Clohesyomyces aquaticus]